jgi:large subunit ribosomal protein L25
MAEAVRIRVEPRDSQKNKGTGTRVARRLRKNGLIPAVIYGHKQAVLPVTLTRDDVWRMVKSPGHLAELDLGGTTETVLIRDVQWDHLGKELLHVDFTRVAVDERIVVTVPLELRGQAPGINAGGTLDQPIHTLSVECLAISIPESIRVNIGELQIGTAIHVRDLVLPEGVKAMSDPDAIVVHVTTKMAEPEAAAPAEVPEQAEPEVIGRQKTEEEEGE